MRSRQYSDVGVIDLFDVEPLSPDEVNQILDLSPEEIIIDCFAGGGGASLGIEWATGRSPDEAINHSASAIAIHKANHPTTNHHHSDIWEVDPRTVARGRKVGILWGSPDCTHHSRAKGGKPVSRKIRALAHVLVRYAKALKPRIIALENVQEFLSWGPISRATGQPDPRRKGHSFRTFRRQLEREGYVVETKLLRGCDFGSPTSRLRLFLIARCDGQPIRWPVPTHSKSRAEMWAAAIMDWSLPTPSIFLTPAEAKQAKKDLGLKGVPKRPLAANTQKRIARGLKRYVIDSPDPFIVPDFSYDLTGSAPFVIPIDNKSSGASGAQSVRSPLTTIVTENRHAIVAPTLIQVGYGEREGQQPRSLDIRQPLGTIVAGGAKHAVVAAWLAKHFGGVVGSPVTRPIDTITGVDHHSLCLTSLVKLKGTSRDGQAVTEPIATIQAQGNHYAEVRAFCIAYFGNEKDGQSLKAPMRTITSRDRLGLVTIHGTDYVIVDIGIRMVSIRERARAQGFPDTYQLAVRMPVEKKTKKGTRIVMKLLTDAEQGEMIGNSVNPHVACALLRANLMVRPVSATEVQAA